MESVPNSTKDEVDFRIIVITYNKTVSVMKCLNALQDLELDGDKAVIDVFLDRGNDGDIHQPTLKSVTKLKWGKGPVNVHQQKEHVGNAGQWIDTWQPRPDSKEIAVILEDNVDLSKYGYRWLKAVHRKYGGLPYVGGISLHEGSIPGMDQLPNSLVFLHAILGTHGFAPVAEHWHDFRLWYHKRRMNPYFHPYVDANPVSTNWFKNSELNKSLESMWSQWYIRFAYDNDLFTVYPNIQRHFQVLQQDAVPSNTYLAYHRQEAELHYASERPSSEQTLISKWHKHFVDFPNEPKLYFYDGQEIRYVEKHSR